MGIEIPKILYELLLTEAAKTGSAVEEIVEFCFKQYLIERNNDIVD